MKSKVLLIGTMGAVAIAAAACGGHDTGSAAAPPSSSAPPPSAVMTLDTAQVLALAQVTSETASPFAVNGGAFVQTDTSETTAPIAVMQ